MERHMTQYNLISFAATVAMVVVSAGPAVSQLSSSCQDLWIQRNTVYKARGYCFKTRRAIDFFGNAGCMYENEDSIPFTGSERELIARIVAREESLGCQR
jgi:YARHG domain